MNCYILLFEYRNGFKTSCIVEDENMKLACFNVLNNGIKGVELPPLETLIDVQGRKCDDPPNSYKNVYDDLNDVLATIIF